MNMVVLSIVGVSMNKIASVRMIEQQKIASNMFKVNDDTQKVSYVHCG